MSGPEYVDQVPRRQAYEAAHPDVEITYHGPYWKAVITKEARQTVITRYELKDVLDMLEALGRERNPLSKPLHPPRGWSPRRERARLQARHPVRGRAAG